MVYGEVRKQVSFKLDKPDERLAYEYANQINFSKFVRDALLAECKRRKESPKSELTVKLREED